MLVTDYIVENYDSLVKIMKFRFDFYGKHLLQSFYLKCLKNKYTLNGVKNPKGFIIFASGRMFKNFKKRKLDKEYYFLQDFEDINSFYEKFETMHELKTPEFLLIQKQTINKVNKSIEKLPPVQKSIIEFVLDKENFNKRENSRSKTRENSPMYHKNNSSYKTGYRIAKEKIKKDLAEYEKL